jgi:hypothetical protein
MRQVLFTILGALLVSLVSATCSLQGQYDLIQGFANSNGCVPLGYYQAQDLGEITPTDLVSTCESACTAMSNCEAIVGELWAAADSNLYTGQCFYYSTVPKAPRVCADHPTILIGDFKDHSLSCFSSHLGAATAFCSSYLSIGTITSYTSTFTPLATSISTTRTTTKKSFTSTK